MIRVCGVEQGFIGTMRDMDVEINSGRQVIMRSVRAVATAGDEREMQMLQRRYFLQPSLTVVGRDEDRMNGRMHLDT
jgi:hypothetical protein